MANIMLDIETLGTAYNAVVLQISMVKFDWNKKIIDNLSLNLQIEPQLIKGRTITQSTIDWWKTQNVEVFKTCIVNQMEPTQVLNRIKEFIKYEDIIWCHTTFDIVILNSLFNDYEMRTPYPYKNARDIRTLVDISNINLNDYDWEHNKTHNSLDDCMFQIDYCCDAWNAIKNWKDISLKSCNSMTKEMLELKLQTLKTEYINNAKQETALFSMAEQDEESLQKIQNIHRIQTNIMNDIMIYDTMLKEIVSKENPK